MPEKTSHRSGIKLDKERCKGCMLCVEVCQRKVLEPAKGVNKKGMGYVVVAAAGKCSGCGLCVMMCPDCGIEIS
ncbi:MAG: 4Fe-4S binding protein [Candidatus Omnitrophica bacterium]|nr:4Fe-4S binding protein [Candidatus Omnitrophota bacterium]